MELGGEEGMDDMKYMYEQILNQAVNYQNYKRPWNNTC